MSRAVGRGRGGLRRLRIVAGLLVAAGALSLPALSPVGAAEAAEASASAGISSLVPPLLAIALALISRDVVVALFFGVFGGALLVNDWNPFVALARTVDGYLWPALADPDHAAILMFTALLGAMVGVVSRSGGAAGIVLRLTPWATSRRRGQVATWAMGVAIFFDDFANTLIVGPTMRPITDRLRISREKLAYIVDSTAAPVVSIVPISTWIGFEIGLVGDAFAGVGIERDAFGAIVASIPYRFYQFFALALGLTIAIGGRDFGAMFTAERRTLETGAVVADGEKPLADFNEGGLEPFDDRPHRARNAVLPIVTMVVVTLLGLWITGSAGIERGSASWLEWARTVMGNADSYRALLWASLSAALVAAGLSIGQRILTVRETSAAAVDGIKAMLTAFVVLILAWSLGAVCQDLGTADFLVSVISDRLAPQLLPVLSFVIAAVIAFATGTSWGTLSILTPLVIPIAHSLNVAAGHGPGTSVYGAVLLGSIASVLSGSVWGDHCSPISDTTILSSMASGCDHLAHVRTQLPYAMLAGAAAALLGLLPAAWGLSPWLALPIGMAVVVAIALWRGRSPEVGDAAGTGSASASS